MKRFIRFAFGAASIAVAGITLGYYLVDKKSPPPRTESSFYEFMMA